MARMYDFPRGVSIVLPCYNSASLLPETLAHVAAQAECGSIPWEVIVIDNNSTDETAVLAQHLWPANHPVRLRSVAEPRQGLSYAIERGLNEARYEAVSFVHDDNWVCANWVRTVAEIIEQHPEAGAVGGEREEVCEVEPPPWFDRFKGRHYAIGPKIDHACDITDALGLVAGAGMTVRKAAWQQLWDSGFRFLTVSRCGTLLTDAEDAELSFALRLAGWRLWHDPRLYLRHYMPKRRLDWRYLRRLARGYGSSTPALDPYYLALSEENGGVAPSALRQLWTWQTAALVKRLASRPAVLFRAVFSDAESDAEVIEMEGLYGRLVGMLATRGQRDVWMRAVRNARWRRMRRLDSAASEVA